MLCACARAAASMDLESGWAVEGHGLGNCARFAISIMRITHGLTLRHCISRAW